MADFRDRNFKLGKALPQRSPSDTKRGLDPLRRYEAQLSGTSTTTKSVIGLSLLAISARIHCRQDGRDKAALAFATDFFAGLAPSRTTMNGLELRSLAVRIRVAV